MYNSAVAIAQATSWTYNEHLYDQSWICAMEFAYTTKIDNVVKIITVSLYIYLYIFMQVKFQ